jgi:hypothetical protein
MVPDLWILSHALGTPYLAGIADVDRGLSKILSKFGIGDLAYLLVGSSVAGSLWWFRIFGSLSVVLDV